MLREKYNKLKERLMELGNVAVAFSGGVDSTFLLYVAKDVLGDKVMGITLKASMYPERETQGTSQLASDIGVKHIFLNANEWEIQGLINNESDRCYHCKRAIFTKVRQIAKKNNIEFVLDGTNADDVDDFRPGMTALKELNIISPLKEVGFTKEEIRILSKELNIPTWNKASMACLASRIPYGTKITKENLAIVEKCEMYLMDLGYSGFRVRYHGELARIELDSKDIEKMINSSDLASIISYFKKVGFTYVTLDLEGYKMGSMNHVLSEEIKENWK